MITQNELSSLNLSPTKKDFVQIWNELIEVASKITERWDPTSTNESDPGIVLLKVLAGIADKLNYNIDKNILEAYMPTAAQMESMRKLCELVGYDIKYYQSAETKVRISYTGNTSDLSEDNDEKLPDGFGLAIPKFTTITNADKDITFVTTNTTPVYLTNEVPWAEIECIEGQISKCESINENNLITLAQLDDENKYYLPEIQIAENGIFVYNAIIDKDADNKDVYTEGTPWEPVSNLNTRAAETRVFKFGYDSFEGRPYIAFPEDVGSLIGDGLFIYFVRTSGLNGNISARTLDTLEPPTGENWEKFSAEQFDVVNVEATSNGANIENISDAYNNFKKTVGTFDTLVTCRDYMNKIYSLMDTNNTPYLSNVLVTDIRNDINSAITLCSCNEFGILYKEMPLTKTTNIISLTEASTMQVNKVEVSEENRTDTVNRLFINNGTQVMAETEVPLIDHFDLRLYPFKTFTQVSSSATDLASPYNRSFTYTEQRNSEIDAALKDFKTCAHNLTTPAEGDVVSINNYLRLNAHIATSMKVSEIEAANILHNVKVALVNEFNLRNLDFGEEIPFDSILSVIENADSRIKVVSLQEPTVLTTYSVKVKTDNGAASKEYGIVSTVDGDRVADVIYDDNDQTDNIDEAAIAKDIYNKLVLRNILAGRASLFDYDETFISNNSEKPYTVTKKLTDEEKATFSVEPGMASEERILYSEAGLVYGPLGGILTVKFLSENNYDIYETYEPSFATDAAVSESDSSGIIDNISRIEAVCEITGNDSGEFTNITLSKNEVIKFRAPNLITTQTFPAYVYYRFERDGEHAGDAGVSDAKYATAISLNSFINDIGIDVFFDGLFNFASSKGASFEPLTARREGLEGKESSKIFNGAIVVRSSEDVRGLIKDNTNERYFEDYYQKEGALIAAIKEYFTEPSNTKDLKFEYYPLTAGTLDIWGAYIKECYSTKYDNKELPDGNVLWRLSSSSSSPKGKLVLITGQRLLAQDGEHLLNADVGTTTYICTDHGYDSILSSISSGEDVELRAGDRLYIHYTPSSTNEDGETVTAEPISEVYEGGSKTDPIIIRPTGFTLLPSDEVNRQGTSWRKTDVDFNGEKKNLLALAPNEQIELRSISKVVLNKPAFFYKNFNSDVLEQGDASGTVHYELKDGEYIFYTDKNAQEVAYYGSGSVITLSRGAYIPRASEQVEVSQILEQGMHIIPWDRLVQLNDSKTVTITEYQYKTLVEGDTLKSLTINTSSNANSPSNANTLGANWVQCDQTKDIFYIVAGGNLEETLPKIMLSSESSVPTTAWEVCSLLELSTAPGYTQQLRATESITNKIDVYITTGTDERLAYTIKPKETVEPSIIAETDTSTISATNKTPIYEPVSVKLSTIAQSATGRLNIKATTDTPSTKMKVFKEELPSTVALYDHNEVITPISDKRTDTAETHIVGINTYMSQIDISNELWRKSTLEGAEEQPNAFKLNFMIPKDTDTFGIFSIYLDIPANKLDPNSKQNIPVQGARVFIDIPSEFGAYQDVISIFNHNNTWWPDAVDGTVTNRLYLRAGLNCIKVNKSCSLFIKAEQSAEGSLLYDNVRLVKGIATNGVNLALLDPNATFNAETVRTEKSIEDKKKLADNILAAISKIDKTHDFYYNVPVENSLAIEFDSNINSFSNPYTLYDINNINNSFVVSKLDVNYLDEGLRIAKSSRY